MCIRDSCCIHHHHAIRIAIERNAQIGLVRQNRLAQGTGRRCPNILVDIQAIRFGAYRDHLGPQLVKDMRCNVVGLSLIHI